MLEGGSALTGRRPPGRSPDAAARPGGGGGARMAVEQQRRSWADAVFVDPPPRWGRRGDPFLWQELHERLLDRPRPAGAAAFEQLLRRELSELCGADVLDARVRAVRVDRYPETGMSGGQISPQAWRDELLPLLTERFGR